MAVDSGEPEWYAYSDALGRKFLHLDQFLKSTGAKAEERAQPKAVSVMTMKSGEVRWDEMCLSL